MPLPSCRKRRRSPDTGSSSDAQPGTGSSNVKVVIRVRPENEKEAGSRVVTQVMNENVLVFDPKENSESGLGGSRKRPRDLRKRQNRDLTFAFDYVFGPHSRTSDIYEQTTKSILTGLLNGYNCSVFAYGATGAGKTHTMLGSKDAPGVMYLTMVDLFNRIDAMKDTKTCDVAVSYLEVYNETIRDLLIPSGCLPIREDSTSGVVIPGLSLHKPKTAEELLYMLTVGNKHRTQHPTDANAESSRSHAVFQVFIRQKDRTANISTEVRIAKLCLVDLAGSERATVTKNRGSRFREGANINRSLLALGNVINALAENKNKGFIPYRDSKLTRLLKDSLGGNCQTVMIAAVSPSTLSFEDTYNTLRYADRAKNIKSTLKKNVLNVDFHIAKYGQIVEELRKEIVELKQKLQESDGGPRAEAQIIQQPVAQDYSRSYLEIENGFAPIMSSRQEQINSEVNLRELQWKMYRKDRCLSRLAVLDEPGNNETIDKLTGLVSSMKQKSEFLATKADVGRDKLVEDSGDIGSLQQRLAASLGSSDGNLPQPLSQCLQVNMLKTELQDTTRHVDYLKRSIRFQQRELQHNERLTHKLLKLIKQQHYIIKGHNIMTSDLHYNYVDIQQIASGQELQWEDQSGESTFRAGYRLADMLELPTLSRKLSYSGPSSTVSVPSSVRGVLSSSSVLPSVKETNLATSSHTSTLLFKPEASVSSMSEPMSQTRQSEMITDEAECSPAKACRLAVTATNTAPPHRVVGSGNNVHSFDDIRRNRLNAVTDVNNKPSPGKSDVLMDLTQIKVDEIDENSPEEVFAPKSKFTKLNDTITKCKKYVKLHSSDSKKSENVASNSGLNGTFTLDSTFTMDPAASQVPLSAVPNVDTLMSAQKNTSHCDRVGQFPSQKCQCVKLHNEPLSRNPDTNNGINGVTENSICDKCSCFVKTHYDVTGSQIDTQDPNDDSGTSTLMNSQATVSTLNNSQELSGISEYMDIAYTRKSRNGILSSNTVNLSDTFTKGDSLGPVVHNGAVFSKTGKVHAARSIKFEDADSSRRGSGGKTASALKKTPERKPLHPMGTGNESPISRSGRVPALSRSQSMVVKSLMGNKGSYSFKTKSYTPNYMKTTKAAARRFDQNSQATDVIADSTETRNNMSQLKKFKSSFFSRKPRPLAQSMRSKSTSNLTSRAAWQL